MSKSTWITILAALVVVLGIEVWVLNQHIDHLSKAEFDRLTID